MLLVRKQFNVQAVAPLIYNLGTIVGGLLLVKQIGVSSLAIGTVAGAFFGPFLLNAVFARRAGTRFRPVLDWHDEGLREWVRLSLPLMAGISLVTADNWIIAHFASQIWRRGFVVRLCQAGVHRPDGDAGAGCGRGFDAVLREPLGEGAAAGICEHRLRTRFLAWHAWDCWWRRRWLRSASLRSICVFTGGRFSAAEASDLFQLLCRISRCLYFFGRRRPSIHELFLRRGTLLLRWSPGPWLRCCRCQYMWRYFTCTEPWDWRSRQISGSRCRP